MPRLSGDDWISTQTHIHTHTTEARLGERNDPQRSTSFQTLLVLGGLAPATNLRRSRDAGRCPCGPRSSTTSPASTSLSKSSRRAKADGVSASHDNSPRGQPQNRNNGQALTGQKGEDPTHPPHPGQAPCGDGCSATSGGMQRNCREPSRMRVRKASPTSNS